MNKNRNSLDLPQQCYLRESFNPSDYAKAELEKCSIPMKEELFTGTMLTHYGEKLMVRNKATAADGQTVEQCLDCPGKTMNQATSDFSDGPVMGGM